jgi:hypothetical protein
MVGGGVRVPLLIQNQTRGTAGRFVINFIFIKALIVLNVTSWH